MAEIDVIVPTRDRPDLLEVCLGALIAQTFTAFRVIVVDDGSSVPTSASLPSSWGKRLSLLVLRNEYSTGSAASRNRALAVARARFLVFLDDDVVAHPDLLARHHAVLARSSGPTVSIGPLLAPVDVRLAAWDHWEADRLEQEYTRIARGEIDASSGHLYGGNFAVGRVDLVEIGGFDGALVRRHDIELGRRLQDRGYRFVFEPAAIGRHLAARSLADWRRLPAADVHYDLMIDRRRPDWGWLRMMRDALAGRHWMLRAARRALRHRLASRLGSGLAAWVGSALYAVGASRIGLAAFSLVWDLEYSRALAAASDRGPATGGVRAPGGPSRAAPRL